jgi:copper chaperone CopZ
MSRFFLGALLALLLSVRCERSGCAYQVPTATAAANAKGQTARTTPHRSTLFVSASNEESKSTDIHTTEPNDATWLAASNRFLASSFKIESYYLIWSPGVWKKLVAGTATLVLAHAMSAFLLPSAISSGMPVVASLAQGIAPLHSLTSNFILPLLASSCCLVQVAMNALSLGCGGFNTVLGPVRPYFMSVLVYLTFLGWNPASIMSKPSTALRWIAFTTLRWSVALLPEALDLLNRHGSVERERRSLATAVPTQSFTATVQMDIPSMGCVGCVTSVDGALRGVEGVHYAASSLKNNGNGGEAHVRLAGDSEAQVRAIADSLTGVVAGAGFFGSTIEAVHVAQNSNTNTDGDSSQ